jgi:hypothetical protein
MQHGQLISHVDTDIVTREQLAYAVTPESTPTFRPIPHIELIESLDTVLQRNAIRVLDERFALRRDGSMLFGVLQLAYGEDLDGTAALGLRTANDRSMSIQVCAGLSVFVCDNLAFRGDLIALCRKHTARLDLMEELQGAVQRFQEHFGRLTEEVQQLRGRELLDTEAKTIIHDVFASGLMLVRLLPEVSGEYFRPTLREFEPRTAWSLHNAFTAAAKAIPLTTRMPALQRVGRLFGMSNEVRDPAAEFSQVIDVAGGAA